jgi:hypothetical protein
VHWTVVLRLLLADGAVAIRDIAGSIDWGTTICNSCDTFVGRSAIDSRRAGVSIGSVWGELMSEWGIVIRLTEVVRSSVTGPVPAAFVIWNVLLALASTGVDAVVAVAMATAAASNVSALVVHAAALD